MTNERAPLSDEDIKEARKLFESFIRMMTATGKKLASTIPTSNSRSITGNNDYYMEVTLRDGSKRKLKTVFHVIEESIEDQYGGVFKCTYHMRNTVDGLFEWLLGNYPRASVNEIQEYADERKISFDEAKKTIALIIAEEEHLIRIKMAKLIHEQLKPTLEVVLADLVEDTGLYGLSEYGYRLTNPKDLEKASKDYISLRKKRTNVIEGVGKRRKASISTVEISGFIEKVYASMHELESTGKKITSHAVARKVIGANHSNPLKAFKDKLKRYGLIFEGLKAEYEQIKSEQKNR